MLQIFTINKEKFLVLLLYSCLIGVEFWQLTCTLYYPGIELKYVCHYFMRPTTWKFKQKKITHISLWLWLSFHFAKWEREKSVSKKMSQICWNSISLGSSLATRSTQAVWPQKQLNQLASCSKHAIIILRLYIHIHITLRSFWIHCI